MSGCSNRVNVLATLIGLVAVVTGLGGVFANIFYGEGYSALAGLAASLTNMVLGFILFYWGLMGLWRHSHS